MALRGSTLCASLFKVVSDVEPNPYDHSSGADIVEVAPAYDNGSCLLFYEHFATRYSNTFTAEITGIAAADLVHDFLSMLVAKEPPKRFVSPGSIWVPTKDEL